jgi:hypothetical protein
MMVGLREASLVAYTWILRNAGSLLYVENSCCSKGLSASQCQNYGFIVKSRVSYSHKTFLQPAVFRDESLVEVLMV